MTRVVVQRGAGPSSSQSRPPSASASAPPSAPGSSSSTPPLIQQLSTLPLHIPSPSTISSAPSASSLSADESSEISAKEAINWEPQTLVTDSSGKSLPLCSLLDGRGTHFEVDLDDRVPGVGSTEADGNTDTAERKREPCLASQLQNVLALEKPREVAEGYGPSWRAEDDAGTVVDVVVDGEAQVEVPENKLRQSSVDLIREVSTDLVGCRKQEDGGVATVPTPQGHQHPVQNMIQLPSPPSVPSTFIPLSVPAPYPHTHVQPVSFGPSLPPLPSHPSPASVNDTGHLSRTYEETDPARSTGAANVLDAVGCSYLAAPSPPAPSALFTSGSSRRGGWVGPSASSTTRGGVTSRRLPRSVKGSRSSPNSSKPTSPRSYGEGDGYNSADEQNPWAPGPSGYEDSMERERQFEIELRRSKGLEVRRMSEDGNCLFRAVADRVYGDADMYDETREMCIDYMEKERDHFSQFVTESFTAYCKRKRRDKVYGNNLEIQAMAEMYNRPIHIYSYSTEPINIFHGSYETDLPPIRLSYHRGNHYNSLVDPHNPAVGAGLGFGSLRGRNVDTEQVKAALKAQQDQQIDKALLAEGSFYSDMELTEQEIERMVMEASRAEFLAGQSFRIHFPWHEETSTSAGAEPSSSGTTGSPKNTNDVLEVAQTADRQPTARPVNLPATSTGTTDNVLPNNVRMLLSMGFSYLRVMEALCIFGDNVNNMLCYLLETESHGAGDGENGKRRKGKVAE